MTLPRLPLNRSGKVDRRALPDPEIGHKATKAAVPRDLVEAQILNIWRNVLGQPDLGVTDDFFKAGGDSLLALEIFIEIEQKLKSRLPLSALFAAPTVALLAQTLSHEVSRPSHPVLVPVRTVGRRPPFFGIHGGDGNVLFYWKLAHLLGEDQPFYALQAATLDGDDRNSLSVETMAERGIWAAVVAAQDPQSLSPDKNRLRQLPQFTVRGFGFRLRGIAAPLASFAKRIAAARAGPAARQLAISNSPGKALESARGHGRNDLTVG